MLTSMASLAAAALEEASGNAPVLTIISGIFGSISMTAWICVILPQMIANYRAKSAEALSIPFLMAWVFGDAGNLIGGLLTNLAPTAVILAAYFCFADVMLLGQVFYYNCIHARRAAEITNAESTEATEDAPLLARRSSTSHSRRQQAEPSIKIVPAEGEVPDLPEGNSWVSTALSLLAVYVIGFLGWLISYRAGAWKTVEPNAVKAQGGSTSVSESIGMTLGTISAVLYLCARIPQIIKNYQDKSCEGLALLFFMLSMTGNLTYSISVLTYSQDRDYLINTIPWLVGSLGTIVEDCIIFMQFRMYANNKRSDSLTQA